MAKSNRLGRGLGALLPGGDASSGNDKVQLVSVADIRPNALQPRREFDPEKLQELAQSIQVNGVLQPIILREKDDHYELIAGERRLRASQLVNLTEIPAIIRTISDDQLLQLALIENIQREDLNVIEEAEAYQQLIAQWGWTQEELAGQVGKSRSAITNFLRLLKLPSQIQTFVREGKLSMGHARALLALPDEESQLYYAQKIIEEGLSVRAVEALLKAKTSAKPSTSVRSGRSKSPALLSLEDRLRTVFGTKVNINQKKNQKGKIEIEFYSNDDLNRIIECISKGG